jgi:hypothetical protein
MFGYDINFGLYLSIEGEIVGFSLTAGAQTEAIEFCSTLPGAFIKGLGALKVIPCEAGKSKIVFYNEAGFYSGEHEVLVSREQGEAIEKLWKNPRLLSISYEICDIGARVVLISEKRRPLRLLEIEKKNCPDCWKSKRI